MNKSGSRIEKILFNGWEIGLSLPSMRVFVKNNPAESVSKVVKNNRRIHLIDCKNYFI